MPVTPTSPLTAAISLRALFDFEEENRLFEAGDDRAYMQMRLARPERTAKPGVAFSLAHKLPAFNHAANSSPSAALPPDQRVEMVVLSRNDPVSGMRVLNG